MKCPYCDNGTTHIPIDWETASFDEDTCPHCQGSGYIKQTNEEYLRSCTREELAEELLDHFMWGTTVNAEECFTKEYISRIKKHIMEWLKEVHNDGKH